MDKNKHDQERVAYNRLITERENSVDDLKSDQRKIEDSLQQLQEDLHRGYRALSILNDEDFRENPENLRLQRRDEEQEHLFKRQLREAEEELSETYTKQRKILDDEVEELYRKRGEVPWD
ncbi:hypothetical protein AF435_14425 [Listeria monocytogenes]|uniref:Uncharacterized protein n=1 Tax=Listeria monocytogenes TaxID=1639 RepID=A0AAN2WJX8_LISMN|nr:hypothetical protein [Listeria monocytogenes]EAC3367798.1 hypothetical protein [Listeria monocytogenes]EAC7086896.1 hypothetical protein [Listeria monocytogenes]EAC8542053.1 hypothetical protein [Listeria monocytogenes]EAC8548055.1 hypothetical protein [Listeria monocytogenes]